MIRRNINDHLSWCYFWPKPLNFDVSIEENLFFSSVSYTLFGSQRQNTSIIVCNNILKMHYFSQSVECVLHRIKFQFIKSIDRNTLARAPSVYLGFWVFWEWMCVLHSNWSFNFYFWNIYAAHRLFLSSQHLILNFSFLCIKCIFHFSRRLGIVFYFLTLLWICLHSLAFFFLLIHV